MIHEILPEALYQSAHLLRMDGDEKRATLKALKISMVINLWSRQDPDIASMWGVEYIHASMPDGAEIPVERLLGLADSALHHIQAGGRVLTQCHAGRNRSGLLNALIVSRVLRVSGQEAMEIVRKGRPRAIANPHHEQYLRSLT